MLLRVENLKIDFRLKEGDSVKAVDGISFDLGEDEYLGIVGESGCGKTTLVKAILKVLPQNGEISGGHIYFKDRDLIPLTYNEMRKIRWKEISIISQDAMNSLNPVHRIGDQIVEAIRAHETVKKSEALARAQDLFGLVGIDKDRLRDYPHQFSGGMRQRAVIAMALALNPSLIIADEPTTALDVIVQDLILQKINDLRDRLRKSMIIITHDVSVVAENCKRVIVMYAGKIVENGTTLKAFTSPYHPYTIGLQNAFAQIKGPLKELVNIPGDLPSLIHPPKGCRFFARCPFGKEYCRIEEPALIEVEPHHFSACHFSGKADEFRRLGRSPEIWERFIRAGEEPLRR